MQARSSKEIYEPTKLNCNTTSLASLYQPLLTKNTPKVVSIIIISKVSVRGQYYVVHSDTRYYLGVIVLLFGNQANPLSPIQAPIEAFPTTQGIQIGFGKGQGKGVLGIKDEVLAKSYTM